MADLMSKCLMAAQKWVAQLTGGLREDEEGQTLVEYALILVLIAIVVIVTLTLVGTQVNGIFNNIANALTNPGG
jgi:pilus assembly protein Flp/PilA